MRAASILTVHVCDAPLHGAAALAHTGSVAVTTRLQTVYEQCSERTCRAVVVG